MWERKKERKKGGKKKAGAKQHEQGRLAEKEEIKKERFRRCAFCVVMSGRKREVSLRSSQGQG
jgi:hypothetical protein